jgi:hypothetical protein
MGRLSGQNAAAAAAAVLRPVQFVKLAFPSATLRFHTWPGLSLSFGGETYTCGSTDPELVAFGGVGERADSKVSSIALTLAATHAQLKEMFSLDKWHFSTVTIGEGYLTEGLALVAEPYSFGNYLMSTGEWSTESGTIQLVCEPVSIRLRRTSLVTSSNADQQARYSGDTFFKYTSALDEREIAWGGRRAIVHLTGGGGGSGLGYIQLPNAPVWDSGITP